MDQQLKKIISTFLCVREALTKGLDEIISLREENKALKEQVVQIQQSGNQLHGELIQAIRNRHRSDEAYVEPHSTLGDKVSEAQCEAKRSIESVMAARGEIWKGCLGEDEAEKQQDVEKWQMGDEEVQTT